AQTPACRHRPRLCGGGIDAEYHCRDRCCAERVVSSANGGWLQYLQRRHFPERLSGCAHRTTPHRAADVHDMLAGFVERFPADACGGGGQERADSVHEGANPAEDAARRGADRMMQYRHLHYFVSVVDAGSFSRAASTIHVAQPALSQQIAQLEEQLGVSLLLRSARGVRPTAAGEVLYREASSILTRLQQLPGIIRSGTGSDEGTVRLGVSSTVLATAPVQFMEQCKASLPNVALRMAVSDSPTIKRRIAAHELDIGLVLEDELEPAFARRPLFRQRLF